MIKLALVIPTLDRSGAEKQLALVAAGLPKSEFDVDVVTLTRGGPYAESLKSQGVRVTCIEKRWRFDPLALWRLRGWCLEHQPDIVHSWLFAANSACRLVLPRSPVEKGGRPVGTMLGEGQIVGESQAPLSTSSYAPRIIVGERCVDSWKSGWQLWLDGQLRQRMDRLVANSQSVADFYAQAGVAREHITVIPNGVERPRLPDFSRSDFLAKLNLPHDAKLVFQVGRLARQKRIRDLIWSAQLLRQADSRARLIIVGDGPERDDLLQFSRDVEVREYIRFLGHREDGPSLLHFADAFWLGSDFEGMSNSLMEAQACGVPVVCTDIPPNRELVLPGETGYVVKVGDSAGFCQFTHRLFQNPELAGRLGLAGRLRMETEFSIERLIARHVELYRSQF